MSLQSTIRCRQIGEADVPAIADLLARGFPARSRAYWAAGLARLGRSDTPAGFPKFGYLLENDGRVVGTILLICKPVGTGEPFVRCNLSSWYVEPAFRSHASMLSMVPLRHKTATFLNISPAPNTWSTIEAQGFVRYTAGQLIAMPALARGGRGLTVQRFRADAPPGDACGLAEADLLAEHDRLGCITLVGTSPEGRHPFAFLPFHAKQGKLRLPGVQLVYCRSMDDVTRFAAPLGRHLLRYGAPFVILDAEGPVAGLPGYFWKGRARKYFKGARRPALGDLAFTEFVIFGP